MPYKSKCCSAPVEAKMSALSDFPGNDLMCEEVSTCSYRCTLCHKDCDIVETKYPSACSSIHSYCIEQCQGSAQAVKKCPDQDCPLWERRNGQEPNRHLHPAQRGKRQGGKFQAVQTVKKEECVRVGAGLVLVIEGQQYKLEKLQGGIS